MDLPGHGTPIEKDGKFYFLHHAYDKKQMHLPADRAYKRVYFYADDWVQFVNNPVAIPKPGKVSDNFKGRALLLTGSGVFFRI
jgi:hypothetical protein